jgi:hypothetical protein
MSYDKNFEKAHKTTITALVNKLDPVSFNLFAIDNDPEIIETFTSNKKLEKKEDEEDNENLYWR